MSQTITAAPSAAHGGISIEMNSPSHPQIPGSNSRGSKSEAPPLRQDEAEPSSLSGPSTVIQCQLERWNWPMSNVLRLGFVSLSFIICGMNDAAVGALIPYLEEHYSLSYTLVSLIFLTPFVGYSLAAVTNARIHLRFGRRGICVIAPICHIITYVVLSLHPPWPVLVFINMLSGFGNGLNDACFCAWVGLLDKANTIQGIIHSCYSLGALAAPLVATTMVITAELPWYTFYYILVGISAAELFGLIIAFWHHTGKAYREEHSRMLASGSSGTREALKSKVTWLSSLFFFAYMGLEVGIGGWVVTFMLRVRKASGYASGISGSGFWAGMTVGRAVLGFVTERYGERLCIAVYLVLSLGLQLLFWLVPQFIVSAVAVALLGCFLGPLFPGTVMVMTKLMPKHVHVSAVGFAMALGGTGGTVFPFAIGALASTRGVAVLQPVVLALLIVLLIVWFCFPRVDKKES